MKYYINKFYFNDNKFRRLSMQEFWFFNDRLKKSKFYNESTYIVKESYVNSDTQFILLIESNKNSLLINKIYNLNGKLFPIPIINF